ncbi:GxxExxY protein [Nevskia sp.]|uniref:GxxExxY protein n=1 Tax=Nevskia sp. TaxID=1929292 RepID=UPI0025F3F647|nr:GxxExxY protein [Nevskia sp.]
MDDEEIGRIVIDAAIEVHRELGPGLFESVYEQVLAAELESRGLRVRRQQSVPIFYKGSMINDAFKADLIVESRVLLELKSVEKLVPLHKKQVLTYLRLGGFRLGYLLNFNVFLLKDGIERLVNGWKE